MSSLKPKPFWGPEIDEDYSPYPQQHAQLPPPFELVDFYFDFVGDDSRLAVDGGVDPSGTDHQHDQNEVLSQQEPQNIRHTLRFCPILTGRAHGG